VVVVVVVVVVVDGDVNGDDTLALERAVS